MKFRTLIIVAVVSSFIVVAVPHGARANHCEPYQDPNPLASGSPNLVISSGYYGIGGIGALDGYGCPAGNHVADTRRLLPQADFVVLVLARVDCIPGDQTEGSLKGLGINAKLVPMTCGSDAFGRKSFVSDLYPLDKTKTGAIKGVALFEDEQYTTASKTCSLVKC